MAYLALLWKARTIEKYRLKYEKEKINSINSKTELRSTFYQKLTVYRNDSQKKLEQIYRNLCPEGSRLANSCTFIKENSSFLLKIVIAIVGGILTYFLFTVFVIQLSAWTVFGWMIGVAIALGVTFNYTVRCLVLLLIPGLFSRVGRYTLACYALVLILTGPATNTLKNLDTLSASLACGQEQIKSSVKEIKESKDSPLNLMKETMGGTVEKVERLAAVMKTMMVRIHRLTMSIAHVLQSSLSWLNSVEATCNRKLGTPYEHCSNILVQGTDDCQKEFPKFQSQWKWDHLVRAVCFNLKSSEPLCVVGDFAKGSIVATVKKKLNTYSSGVQSMLATDVHIHRSHSCCNGSLPVSQAAAGVITDLRNRADTLLAWLSWTCALTGLFLMLIIFRAKYYLHMFRTRSRFDNRYVTKELRELDLKRQRQGRETVLPLNTRERAKYVSTSSIRLLPSERMYLTRSIVFMVITTLKLMIHMVADYSLYWVLTNVRFHGSEQNNFQPTNRTERIHVSGSGPLAATVRVLVEALSVPLILPAASTAACLPDPNPPDLQRYAQIGTLILLLWLLALFEPYGLRLRHVISGHYQPERAKARAVWLYYHIIRTRSCFLKFARRKLHRQFKYMSEEKCTFRNWLNKCIPCQWLRTFLRVGPVEPHCLLCCTKHRQEDLDRHLKRCETPSCPGVYCARCFADIGQLCTICYSPEDYGDLSDVSLEKFTSDDSGSDDSDDFGDDNIPLMGRPDYKTQEDEQGMHNNRNQKSNSLKPRSNDNQESTPLLNCNYLKKDYSQYEKIVIKHDNTLSLHKVEDINEENEAVLKTKQMKDEYKEIQVPRSGKGKKTPMVFNETEITVNGITFPKGKLSAIVNVMMLLTTKDEHGDKYKSKVITKHKPFEYLVMEMFQPFHIFQRLSQARHSQCSNNQCHSRTTRMSEPFETEIRFLFDNSGFARKSHSADDLPNSLLQTDFNYKNSEPILKYVQSGEKTKELALTKLTKHLWSARRNVKRFLDVKRSITSSVIEKSKNIKMGYDKYKFSCKKRRRRNKNDIALGIASWVSKVFSNKSIGDCTNDPSRDALGTQADRNSTPVKTSVKKEKTASPTFVNHLKFTRQEDKCGIKNNSNNLSNSAKEETVDIHSPDRSNNDCHSNQSNKVNIIKPENNTDLKTSTVQAKHKNNKKLGFWGSLRLRRRRNRSPHLFSINLKNEPSFYNFFSNYKRKKKRKVKKEEDVDFKANNVNVDAQIRRESRIDENTYRRMAKYNGIMEVENNEFVIEVEPNISECLENQELNTNQDAGFIDQFDEAKIRTEELNATLADDIPQGRTREYEVRTAREFIILYDDKNHENENPSKFSNFTKKIRSISRLGSNHTKNKPIRSVAFSDGLVLKISDSDGDVEECERTFIQVESAEQLENEPPCRHNKMVHYENSYESIYSDDDRCLHDKTIESQDSEESIEITQHSTNVQVNLAKPCVHEWKVEPKKQEACQACLSDDDSGNIEIPSYHIMHRCFQTSMQGMRCHHNDVIVNTSLNSLHSSKNIQKDCCHCNDRSKKNIENEAMSKLQERWCCCEEQCKKQQPARMSHSRSIMRDTAVQSHETNDCASTYHAPAKPHKSKIIREVTERIILPSESDDVILEYTDEKTPRPKRNKRETETRRDTETANRSTTTITKTVADVSTITSDWWSPMLDRKPIRRKPGSPIGNGTHENKYHASNKDHLTKWRPSLYHDHEESTGILSASNYLLQSEKYYSNQVYSMEMLSSSRGSHTRVKQYSESEKPSFKMYRHLRKGCKAKRLKETNPSRKKVTTLQMHSSSLIFTPAKWRPAVTEEQAHALKYYKRRNPNKIKKKHLKSRKLKQEKESVQYANSQTNSNMWTASIFSNSF